MLLSCKNKPTGQTVNQQTVTEASALHTEGLCWQSSALYWQTSTSSFPQSKTDLTFLKKLLVKSNADICSCRKAGISSTLCLNRYHTVCLNTVCMNSGFIIRSNSWVLVPRTVIDLLLMDKYTDSLCSEGNESFSDNRCRLAQHI